MTQPTTISQDNNCLSYQFFFLMRSHWWKGEDLIQEPFYESDWIKVNDSKGKGVKIDNDKRLFRYDVPNNTSLQAWQQHLVTAWQDVHQVYHQAFASNKIEIESNWFCQNILLGVGLLILDKNLEQHHVEIQIEGQEHNGYFECCCKEVLFQLQDKAKEMPKPATFHAFEVKQPGYLKQHNLALQLQGKMPLLRQMSQQTGFVSFAVFGLAHGDDAAAIKEGKQWPYQLNKVLLGDSTNPTGQLEILNVIMARLLINYTVFQMLDYESRDLRYKLQKADAHYLQDFDYKALKKLPDGELHEGVLTLGHLINQTNHIRGRIIQVVETLMINHNNFKVRLSKLYQEHPDWNIDWDIGSKYDDSPPLLNEIHKSVARLKNHEKYIEGKLINVVTARERWQSCIEESGHALLESLGHIGGLIAFLIALAEMGNLIKLGDKTKQNVDSISAFFQDYEQVVMEYFLQNPHFYTFLFTLSIVYILYTSVLKKVWKFIVYRLFKKRK